MQAPTSTAESTLAARTERLQAALERARERGVRLRVSARGDWLRVQGWQRVGSRSRLMHWRACPIADWWTRLPDLLTDVVGSFDLAGPLA